MVGAGAGAGASPPAARPPRFLDAEGARPARLVLGVLAIVLALDGFVIWALSFVPGYPAATVWAAFVMPAFVLMFVPFGAMVLNEALNRPPAARGRAALPRQLRGWRGVVGGLVFGAVWASGALVLFSGDLAGQPKEVIGRYTSNDHGVVTELTEEQYLQQSALSSRLFAGGVLAFSTIAALVLTAKPVEDDTDQRARARLSTPHEHRSVPMADLRGHRRVQRQVPGSSDDVVARLQAWFVLRADAAADGSTRVVGEWDAGKAATVFSNPFPVLVDGSLRPDGSTTAVDLSIRLATKIGEWAPLGGLWMVVIMVLAAATIGRAAPFPISIFVVGILGAMGYGAYQNVTAPRRAARSVEARIAEALGVAPPPIAPR